MPTELELQEKFGVSRYCVREALQVLKDCGMVSARAGIGHEVVATEPADNRYMHGSTTLEELVQSARTTLHVLESRDVKIDAASSVRSGFSVGIPAVEIDALRVKLNAKEPIALLTLTLRPAHSMMSRYMEGEQEAFHIVLERRFGVRISGVQQRILATNADARSARILMAPVRQPCLSITRRFLDDRGEVIFASVGLYPSDRFSHDTAFKVHR